MDWQAEYAKVVALDDEGDASTSTTSKPQAIKTPSNNVLAFLDLLLAQEGGEWWTKLRRRTNRALVTKKNSKSTKSDGLDESDKKKLKAMKKRLAAIAGDLIVKLPELNASVSTNKSTKVRVLQLQLLCRMLRYGVMVKKHKEQRKQLKKEIRGLLDRVALLLDAENPPSLADEDERSPFQEFLQLQLTTRLQLLLPELVKYLLRAYELDDEEETKGAEENDTLNALLHTLQPLVKPPQPPLTESPKSAVKGSILSALREERPAKRPLPDTSGLFKEVQLPHQLQQNQAQSRPRKTRRVSKTHRSSSSKTNSASSNAGRSSQDSLLRAATVSASTHKPKTLDFAKPGLASNSRKPGDLRRAAMASSTKGPVAPFLHRAISERSHFTGQPLKMPSSTGTIVQVGGAATTGKNQSPPLRRAATTSSVVMRTPDRPKRMTARNTRRVLVEASPPLRRPNGGSAAPRLLQPKSSRPGTNPPPLFR